jgi:hypothetical protein
MADLKKSKKSRLSGVSGTWFEIPLIAVQQVEMRPLKLLKGKEMKEFFRSTFQDKENIDTFMTQPAVELVYDEQAATGRVKDYMQALFNTGIFTKLEKAYDKLIIAGEEVISIMPTIKAMVR